MREDRYVRLLDRLVDAAREPAAGADARQTPASDAAGAVERAWRRLEKSVHRLGVHPTDEDLHTVRIRSKRVRYAAEALIPVFRKPARRFATRAAKLQDILGEHQDAVVAEGWLRNATRGARSGAAFVAGELTAAERRSAENAAAAWPAAWDRLRRKRLRFWA
jgi:CHAD domain-containing protein